MDGKIAWLVLRPAPELPRKWVLVFQSSTREIAALIVRAVNSHDELLEVVGSLLGLVEMYAEHVKLPHPYGLGVIAVKQKARNVISKTEGGKP